MEFIETSVFTRAITRLISDEEYTGLQSMLAGCPEAGDLIPGGGGLRKVRWSNKRIQKGKRGGVRVIYYVQSGDSLYMIYAYSKNKQEDLTARQLKALRLYAREGVL